MGTICPLLATHCVSCVARIKSGKSIGESMSKGREKAKTVMELTSIEYSGVENMYFACKQIVNLFFMSHVCTRL
jgi:hypothetical protein